MSNGIKPVAPSPGRIACKCDLGRAGAGGVVAARRLSRVAVFVKSRELLRQIPTLQRDDDGCDKAALRPMPCRDGEVCTDVSGW